MNLDNILVKAKEVFENAYKKADDVVSAQKQKFDISSLESKLNKDFESLGKLCFESLKTAETFNSQEIGSLVETIKSKSEQLEDMKKEALKNKNKKLCSKCGAAIDKNAVFCNLCGIKVSEEE